MDEEGTPGFMMWTEGSEGGGGTPGFMMWTDGQMEEEGPRAL